MFCTTVHGCEKTCTRPCVQNAVRAPVSNATDAKIQIFLSGLARVLGIPIAFHIVSDCPTHTVEHPDPDDDDSLLTGPRKLHYKGRE
jgi:hypothetical protein